MPLADVRFRELHQRSYFPARSDFDLDQIRDDTHVTVCRCLKCNDVSSSKNADSVARTMSALGLGRFKTFCR